MDYSSAIGTVFGVDLNEKARELGYDVYAGDWVGKFLKPSNKNYKCAADSLKSKLLPDIKRVVFNDPATIVLWEDGTKAVVKCQKDKGDVYSKEVGLAMAIVKKVYGNKGNFNDVFSKWIDE